MEIRERLKALCLRDGLIQNEIAKKGYKLTKLRTLGKWKSNTCIRKINSDCNYF